MATKLKKIRLIEEPKSEELLRKELEETLGGYDCVSYSYTACTDYDSGKCTSGTGAENYCHPYYF